MSEHQKHCYLQCIARLILLSRPGDGEHEILQGLDLEVQERGWNPGEVLETLRWYVIAWEDCDVALPPQ